MTRLPERLVQFLSQQTGLTIGRHEIIFFKPDELEEAQEGYSLDEGGQPMPGTNWEPGWMVIATDDMGDPIFVDVGSPELVVLSAAHDEGDWEASIIADTLKGFAQAIALLKQLAAGRENPQAMAANPLTDADRQQFLAAIEAANPNAELWYWELFLED